MRSTRPRELQFYQTSKGSEPFTEWFKTIRDTRAQSSIRSRLLYLEQGNFGDYRSVGGGVFEMRIHIGAGYRVYFAEIDNTIVLLLCGGDKASQTRDIRRAKTYWQEYKEAHT
ncbi:MAG: type II toxin-antitoxin system RelE/ParE family toxin [Candidatus Poribacteria bacterium]|nr:type II toxin-antitoxin system RelE/ParE family toxin [Candidatus Poribacteria bacterium]MYK18854.1 type II toxin-antitoxin system RelE/ParE family toxin [Candidatus Poribacteria bacterium]